MKYKNFIYLNESTLLLNFLWIKQNNKSYWHGILRQDYFLIKISRVCVLCTIFHFQLRSPATQNSCSKTVLASYNNLFSRTLTWEEPWWSMLTCFYIYLPYSLFFLKENINNRKNIVYYLLNITSLLACLFVSSEPHIRQSV